MAVYLCQAVIEAGGVLRLRKDKQFWTVSCHVPCHIVGRSEFSVFERVCKSFFPFFDVINGLEYPT